ncbi:hypothetical protein BJX96DRAFT_186593 [Aspergillus floccosus]
MTKKTGTYFFDSFDNAKKVPGTPQGCLWGFYDRDAVKDQVVSAKEVQSRRHVLLDWRLHSLSHPGFGRRQFSHRVLSSKESLGAYGFDDDEIHINTQSGSQWDSLRHHASQRSHLFYNGLTFDESLSSDMNGTHNWYGSSPNPITRYEIKASDIIAAMKDQDEERKKGAFDNHQLIGVEASEETVRWLYDQHFAALVGDTVAFEAWHPQRDSKWILHDCSLVWWRTPLGEMWDLESLSRECEMHQRWTFMVTSAPLHVKGGVGSPTQAIAIF